MRGLIERSHLAPGDSCCRENSEVQSREATRAASGVGRFDGGGVGDDRGPHHPRLFLPSGGWMGMQRLQ